MARFHFWVVFVPGKELSVADTFARVPVDTDTGGIMAEAMNDYVSAVALAGLPVSDNLFEEIRQATLQDKQLSALLPIYETRGHLVHTSRLTFVGFGISDTP